MPVCGKLGGQMIPHDGAQKDVAKDQDDVDNDGDGDGVGRHVELFADLLVNQPPVQLLPEKDIRDASSRFFSVPKRDCTSGIGWVSPS